MSGERVCVVLVTYNRLDTLRATIEAIRRQTVPVDDVLVIDNASTDATARTCSELFRQDGYSAFRHVRLERNSGGAGGFHAGMKLAHELGHPWIWLMDDDVAPAPDCLEAMLRWKDISSCIHPLAIEADGQEYHWARVAVPGSLLLFGHSPEVYSKMEWHFSNMACFEGMLIRRDVVDRVGYPDERFFISWDDSVYGMQVSRVTNILCVRSARLNRLLPRKEWDGRSLYYAVRNVFLAKDIARESVGGVESGGWILNFLVLYRILRPQLSSWTKFRAASLGVFDGLRRKWGPATWTF